MKKKKLFLLATSMILLTLNVAAQWSPTYTLNNVGIGTTVTPTDAALHINTNNGMATGCMASLPTLSGLRIDDQTSLQSPSLPFLSHKIFEINHQKVTCGFGILPYQPVFFVNVHDYLGFPTAVNVGINKSAPSSYALDIGGSFNADLDGNVGNNLTVNNTATITNAAITNATIGSANIASAVITGANITSATINTSTTTNGTISNATITNNLLVQNGQIDMTMPLDGSFRNINANSSAGGLALNSGTGSRIELYAGAATGREGNISFVSGGPTTSLAGPTGISYYHHNSATSTYTNLMHIWNNGKVTIGSGIDAWIQNPTHTPDGYLLYVQKGILTEKLKVQNTTDPWSDFVFNDDYELMPLSQLETYVTTNKHLPEIPSADEVKENGIDVASMDAKLLQKIEELTLYLIKQQKQIEQQKSEIEVLKKKMN